MKRRDGKEEIMKRKIHKWESQRLREWDGKLGGVKGREKSIVM